MTNSITAKLCIYGVAIIDGGLLPFMVTIFVVPSGDPPTYRDLFMKATVFCGLYLVSFGLVYAASTLGGNKSPLVGLDRDPFVRLMTLGTARLPPRCGSIRRLGYKMILVSVPIIGVTAAIYCIWIPLIRIAEYGANKGVEITFPPGSINAHRP